MNFGFHIFFVIIGTVKFENSEMESNKRKAEEMGSGMDDGEKDLKRIKAEIRKVRFLLSSLKRNFIVEVFSVFL